MSKILNFFLKFFTIIIITILSAELISYILLKFDSTELFQIRNFTEKVNDKRVFTLKRNFSENINKQWSVISSNERLRISKYDVKTSNYLSESNFDEKFLFLGDSVPFGWGVNAEESLPYLFQKYNKDLVVLNAALPSYSLAQSVERYEKEFKNLKSLKFIFLQIYDPVEQYSILGINWNVDDNWANHSKQVLRPYNLIDIKLPFYGEPLFYDYFKIKLYRIKRKKLKESPYDDKSDYKFVSHINSSLNKINNLIKDKKIFFIISPTVINNSSINNLSKSHLRTLKMQNKNLKEFSERNKNVYYFDVSSQLNLDPKKTFIDLCCHLSDKGADLVAKELTKLITKLD